jgi:hypothetical protein
MPDLRLVLAGVLVVIAGLLWLALLRRVPEQTSLATILSKGYVSASTYTQHPVEVSRSFRTPREIPIAESYLFELRLDGVADPVRASFNTVKSRQFEVGQRVRVQYVRRGLPLLPRRIAVLEMISIEPQ